MSYPAQPTQPALERSRAGRGAHGRRRARQARRSDLRTGVVIVLALAVLGALLGFVWERWSPAGPRGFVIAPHAVQPDETESFVAADGRFAVICAAVGLVAGLTAWWRRSARGPITATALAVGGLAGAGLTDLVGHLRAGGSADGKAQAVIPELPLWVHMHGLLVLEAVVAVLVYGLCVAFAAADDLGRTDPQSVRAGDQPQFGGSDRDAPGAYEQPYLPPQ